MYSIYIPPPTFVRPTEEFPYIAAKICILHSLYCVCNNGGTAVCFLARDDDENVVSLV